YDTIDYLVAGNGEEAFLRICKGGENEIIPILLYKKQGKIFEYSITYVQEENQSGDVYLSHLDELLISHHASRFGTFYIFTHKGCSMNCCYCGGCNRAQRKTFNRKNIFRRGTAEVWKDIEEVKPFASTLQFEFDIPYENLTDYCREIWRNIDLSGHFCIFSTLTLPSPQLVEHVSKTFKYIHWDFDICSLSQRHRKKLETKGMVKPQLSDEQILEFMEICENYPNIEVRLNLITGLPFFEPEDVEPGEKLLAKINTYTSFGELHWARLHAQPGAPIIESADEHGMQTYASTFGDFLKYSRENFERGSGYATVENFNYPYIYFKEDRLNSTVTRFYLEINKKLEENREDKEGKPVLCETLTYRQLNAKANRLAAEIKAHGTKPGDIVALKLERALEIPISILAVLKTGSGYLPIDPEAP
ncbi:MAG: AMP-binding protein, partial [bacterium]|nr:AMP-binding protein [bacterium]